MEQARLMKEAGVNPAAGCLPLILQILMINFLYNAFYRFIKAGLETKFLIWDLAKPDIIKLSVGENSLILPGILVFLAALSQFIQIKMVTPKKTQKREKDKDTELKKKEKEEDFQESLTQSQEMMAYMFPLMFLLIGTKWPSGLALYWTVATVMAIGQQWFLNRKYRTENNK